MNCEKLFKHVKNIMNVFSKIEYFQIRKKYNIDIKIINDFFFFFGFSKIVDKIKISFDVFFFNLKKLKTFYYFLK